MAKLKKQILGEVSGTLGTFVFRGVKGKNVIGVRPSNVNVPNDPASIERRDKFKMSSKLAQAILVDSNLKKLWAVKTPYELNTHNYIIQQNYKSVSSGSLSNVIRLVPEFGFPLDVTSVAKSESELSIIINSLNVTAGYKSHDETKIMMSSILFLSNPVDTSVPLYSFISVASATQIINTSVPLTFTTSLDGPLGTLYSKYQEQKMFFVIITLNDEDLIIQHSSTYVD